MVIHQRNALPKSAKKREIFLIAVAFISLSLMLIDKEHNLIYASIVQLIVFIFFLQRGLSYRKSKRSVLAVLCFTIAALFVISCIIGWIVS